MLSKYLKCLIAMTMFSSYTLGAQLDPLIIKNKVDLCNQDKPIESFEVEKYLNNKYPKVDSSVVVHDVEINDVRTGQLSLFLDLTRKIGYEDNYIPADTLFQNDDYKNCQSVMCLADEVFGKGLGAYHLYILDRYHLNLSYLVNQNLGDEDYFDNMTKFTKEELEVIIRSLNIFPKDFLKNIKYGHHAKKIDHYKGNVIANAKISFFKLWSDQSSSEKIYTVIHELGHVIADIAYEKKLDIITNHSFASSDEWTSLSGWKWDKTSMFDLFEAKRDYSHRNFVSRYASQNPSEDFAESFTYYILNPDYLKLIAPKKYTLIKEKVFNNTEFSSFTCSIDLSLNNDYPYLLESEDKKVKSNGSIIGQECVDQFVTGIHTQNFQSFNRCLYLSITQQNFFPLTISPDEFNSRIERTNSYKSTTKYLIDQLIDGKKMFNSCSTHPTLAIDIFYSYGEENILLKDGSSLAKNLCRLVHLDLKRGNKKKSVENYKKSARRIMNNYLPN